MTDPDIIQPNTSQIPLMAWLDADSDGKIGWSPPGKRVGFDWPDKQQLTDRGTANAPAVANVNGRYYMAWRGYGGDAQIYWSTMTGSTGSIDPAGPPTWTPQAPALDHNDQPLRTGHFPALGSHNGQLIMVWRPDSGPLLRWAWLEGDRWRAAPGNPGFEAASGAGLASHDGVLYMAWRAPEGSQRIYWATYLGEAGEGTFDTSNPAEGSSSATPTLASSGDHLHMAWKGVEGDDRIWWARFDGSNFPQEALAHRATRQSPALARIGQGELVMAWTGLETTPHLWWSSYRKGQWGEQHPEPDRRPRFQPALSA